MSTNATNPTSASDLIEGPGAAITGEHRSSAIQASRGSRDPILAPTGESTGFEVSLKTARVQSQAGSLDRDLLSRAADILVDVDTNDSYAATLALGSLRTIVYQLWHSASRSSSNHQRVLAILERALLSTEEFRREQLPAFREAVADLSLGTLTAAHVEALRSAYIDLNCGSLSILSELDESDDEPTEQT